MKQLFFTALITFSLLGGCKKDSTQNCNMAVINNKESSCGFWTITRDGLAYEADKLPDEYKVDGLQVCAEFNITTNPIACVCCLDKATIVSISRY